MQDKYKTLSMMFLQQILPELTARTCCCVMCGFLYERQVFWQLFSITNSFNYAGCLYKLRVEEEISVKIEETHTRTQRTQHTHTLIHINITFLINW